MFSNGRVTENFKRSEFACKCGCGFDIVDIELVFTLEALRRAFNQCYGGSVTIVITGPNRCKGHNRRIGGAKDSMHCHGKAVDFKMYDKGKLINPDIVADFLDECYDNKYGIGKYIDRVHLDIRADKARWSERDWS